MIHLSDLSFSYGHRKIFDKVNISFDNKRIALVGRNGSGKTTFFKLVTNEITEYSGEIIIGKNSKIGYLHQEMNIESNIGIIDYILNNIDYYKNYSDALKMVEENPDEKNMKKLNKYENIMKLYNGFALKERIKNMLLQLGLEKHINKNMNELSYGYKMRTMLCKLLIENNDILLLDEPTNHLDLPSIRFVEDYLNKQNNKTIIIVSHDRTFLDNTCEYTIEIRKQNMFKYKGNYSFFINEREKILEKEKENYENLIKMKKDLEFFINKWKAKNTKSSMAMSRAKILKKINNQINNIDIIKSKDVKFSINRESLKSKTGIKCIIKNKQYNNDIIFENTEIDISPDDRIFLIGKNGIGKSTLIRILSGDDNDYEGNRQINEKINMLVFNFDRISQLPGDMSLLEYIMREDIDEYTAKTLLGMMMFNEYDFDKKIKVLSGGEKVRIYMTKLFTEKFNYVILDEPTNYLDIETIDVFVKWLRNINTGFIIVTHNEYLLNNVNVNYVWTIENKKIRIHFGNYNKELINNNIINNTIIKKKTKIDNKKLKRQEIINKRIEINKKIDKIENKIDSLENEREELFNKFSNINIVRSGEDMRYISKRIDTINKELVNLYKEWEVLINEKPELK